MRSFRDQRLTNDFEELSQLQRQLNHGGRTMLEIEPVGSRPHQAYNLIFRCAGFVDEAGTVRQRHHLFLEFPKLYPVEVPPTFKRVSPLFHPNIYPHGVFCLGFEGERKWRPGISLESLVLHVSRFIRFDPDWVNLNPPANRTQEFWEGFIKKFRPPADLDPFVVGEEPSQPSVRQSEVVRRPATAPVARRTIRVESSRAPGRQSSEPGPPGTRRPTGPIRIRRNNPGP